jgi:SAM-dependent methyltransferase
MNRNKQDYLNMQNKYYDQYAAIWSLEFKDPVVGSYDAHNEWEDYDTYLFKDFDTTDLIALDYGCGPGRNIIKFHNRFKRIDGVDISNINLEKSRVNLEYNDIAIPNLYHTSGDNLSMIEDSVYDVMLAVICNQHICVHEIRFKI